MHANSAAYKDSMFFTTLNNMANVSEKLETITPYTTTIKFNTKIKKDD